MRRALATIAAMILAGATAAMAREPLGIFGDWGTFSDRHPRHCFAIAEPRPRLETAGWRPFAAVASWPARGIRAQVNIRLRKPKRAGAPVILTVGDSAFTLAAGSADAWAPNTYVDGRIVAAMRSAATMRVETVDRAGRRLIDSYPLRGAATAIDAATLACAGG